MKTIFAAFGLILLLSHSVFGDIAKDCDILSRQVELLDEKGKKSLSLYGIAEVTIAEDVPPVVISGQLIPECKARLMVSRHISSFLYNKPEYKLSPRELRQERQSICKVVNKMLQAPYAWTSSGYQNLERLPYELANKDLMPDWLAYLKKQPENEPINFDYFTDTAFLNPDSIFVNYVDRDLKKSRTKLEAAELYMLKKNLGLVLNLQEIEKDLMNRSMPPGNGSNPDAAVPMAVKLLKKRGKITLTELRNYHTLVTGSAL